jgi:hypothetical protein
MSTVKPAMSDPTHKTSASDPSRIQEKTTRRSVVRSASILIGLALPGLAKAQEGGKASKSEAGYKDAPNGGQRCDVCAQFLPPTGCKLVAGSVSPSGWCNFFAPRPR